MPVTSGQHITICRDFIWGICVMGEDCKFRHELDLDAMKSILKFCHDFQNRRGCLRSHCTYIHTSRKEQDLFLDMGRIPRVLALRYAVTASDLPVDFDSILMPPPPPPPPRRARRNPPLSSIARRALPLTSSARRVLPLTSNARRASLNSSARRALPLTSSARRALPLTSSARRVLPLTSSSRRVLPLTSSARSAGPLTSGAGPSSMASKISSTPQLPVGQLTMSSPKIGPVNVPMSSHNSAPITSHTVTSHDLCQAMIGSKTALKPSVMPAGIVTVEGRMLLENSAKGGPLPPHLPPPAISAPTTSTSTEPIYPTQVLQLHQTSPPIYSQAGNNHKLPQLPIMFDPATPSPPVSMAAKVNHKRNTIHTLPTVEAGTSKIRKVDGLKDGKDDQNCIQTQLRIEFYQQEMEKLEHKPDFIQSLYAKKTEYYTKGTRFLNSLFKSDMLQLLDDKDEIAQAKNQPSMPEPSTSAQNVSPQGTPDNESEEEKDKTSQYIEMSIQYVSAVSQLRSRIGKKDMPKPE